MKEEFDPIQDNDKKREFLEKFETESWKKIKKQIWAGVKYGLALIVVIIIVAIIEILKYM